MAQTLTYVIGQDRRAHVDDVQNFKVNFDGGNSNWVQARQYERSMRQVFVNIKNEDGTPFDLTGCNVWFEGLLPKNSNGDFRIIDDKGYVALDPSAGRFRFDMPGHAFTVAGSYRQAFFRIVKDSNSVTTLEFDLDVLADKVIDGLVPRTYISPVEELIDEIEAKYQDSTDKLTKMTSDFVDKFTQTMSTLQALGTTVQSSLDALEQKIKTDGLFTQAEAEAFENKIQGALSSYGLNVKLYGAKGDGVTDDTAAIQAAIDDANKKNHIVFVPAGKYLVTKTLKIDHLALYGENNTDTVLIGTAAIGELLLVGSNCYVHGLCLSVNGAATTTNVSLIRIGSQSGSMFNSFNDINIKGSKDINCIGIYANPYGTKGTIGSNCSFANRFTNISMDDVDVGIKLDANNFSWINGNSFTHVLIRNVKTSGIWLTSSVGNNQQGIYKNVFDDVQIQYLDTSGSQSRAILIQCGRGNKFTHIVHWNDASTKIPSIELSGSAGAQEIEIRDNMVSGAVEGEIIATPKLRGLNEFEITSETSDGHSFNNSSTVYDSKIEYPTNNLIGSDVIDQFVSQPHFVPLTIGPSGSTAVVNTGYDDAGAYLSVKNTGASATNIFLTLPPKIAKKLASSPASTTSALFDVNVADVATINLGSYVALYDNNGKTYSCDITAKFTETDRQEYAMTCIQDGGKWGISSHDVGGAYLIVSLSGAAEFKIRGIRLTDQYASHYRSINNVRGCSTFWLETVANKDINNFGDFGLYIPLDTIVALKFTKSWIRKLDNGATQLVNYPFVI